MKKPSRLDLTKTAAALAAYDRADAAIDTSGHTLALALKAAERARVELAHAFADDAADRNDRLTVIRLVMEPAGLDFVRGLVADLPPENRPHDCRI